MIKYIEKLNSVPMLWVSGICLFISFILEYIFPLVGIAFELAINPAWISLIISGIPLAYLAVVNTMKMRITSPLLITIAMIAAVYIGDVFAAGEVAFIMAIGEHLEDRTVEKAKKGIEKLLTLVPETGRRISIQEDGTIKEETIEAKGIQIGDVLRVLPGESFPADAQIIKGNTSVDQSILTGESLPIDKTEGDTVFTGTINRFGSVDVRVTKPFAESSLQKMIRLVEEAENNKAPMQKTVDKWAAVLVPTACVIAIATYLVFRFLLNAPDDALIRAVTVLVVFCPCALALATPTSIMAAIGQATKRGVLIKSGEALERMGQVTTVAFDKTGTITTGRLALTDIQTISMDEKALMEKVVSVESHSEHPIAKAIMQYAFDKQIPIADATEFSMTAGKGIKASVGDAQIFCGNERLVADCTAAVIDESTQSAIDSLREQGKAVVVVCDSSTVLGLIGLSDTLKDTSKTAIAALGDAGITKTVLLTGDNEKSANYIAGKVGITDVHASLLPQNKVEAIKNLGERGETVCMVGDGVNDAPALKTAAVGIAMGTMGSDIAIDAADIAIMGDDIEKISYIKKLSNATLYSIKFNITLSMIINFGAIILSIGGLLNPATGALVHNAGSILVVLNAARLYEKKI